MTLDPLLLSKKEVNVELARGGTRLFRNISVVKKVIPTARNTEPIRRPTQGESVPSHGKITLQNTEHLGRSLRECRVPSHLNDFHLS